MGSPKTQTVGGGSATGTADLYNQFLQNGLRTGTFGSTSAPNTNPQSGFFNHLMGMGSNGPNGAATGAGQAQGQTNSFGNAINSMLGGTVGNPNSYSSFFDLMKGSGDGGFGGMGQTSPQYNYTNFDKVGSSNTYNQLFGEGGFGSNGFNPQQAQGGTAQGGGGPQIGDAFGAGGTGGLLNYNTNSPEFQALKQVQDRQTQLDQANLRSRYSAGGGSSLGSGASLAESQLLAEANPRNVLNLQQMGQNMQQIDMANRGLNAQTLLAQRGQNVDMRGQDISSATQASIANANNSTAASIANAGNSTQSKIAQMSARLQAMGMDADSAYRAAMANNANSFGENQAHNAYNQNDYQFGINSGLANQNMKNQYALGQGNIGLGMAGLSQQGMTSILQQLFGGFNQSNQIGNPQAQTVQTPNAFSQGLGAFGQLANIGSSLWNGYQNMRGNNNAGTGSFGGGVAPGGFQFPGAGSNPLGPNQRFGNGGYFPQQQGMVM